MNFKEAQAYATQYLSDPENKAAYKALCKPGQKPINVLMSELLKKEPPPVDSLPIRTCYRFREGQIVSMSKT